MNLHYIIIHLKKNIMKKLIMCVLFFIGLGLAVNAQTSTTKEKAPKEKVAMKEHICTDACHKAGKCVTAKGEKACTKACCKEKDAKKDKACKADCKKPCCKDKDSKKDHACEADCKKECCKDKKALKDHVCTDACHKEGKCVMTHGEKGHVCSKDCKKA